MQCLFRLYLSCEISITKKQGRIFKNFCTSLIWVRKCFLTCKGISKVFDPLTAGFKHNIDHTDQNDQTPVSEEVLGNQLHDLSQGGPLEKMFSIKLKLKRFQQRMKKAKKFEIKNIKTIQNVKSAEEVKTSWDCTAQFITTRVLRKTPLRDVQSSMTPCPSPAITHAASPIPGPTQLPMTRGFEKEIVLNLERSTEKKTNWLLRIKIRLPVKYIKGVVPKNAIALLNQLFK